MTLMPARRIETLCDFCGQHLAQEGELCPRIQPTAAAITEDDRQIIMLEDAEAERELDQAERAWAIARLAIHPQSSILTRRKE